MMENATLEQIS
jgi:hypothetical protein